METTDQPPVSTLTTPPVSALLNRLFAAADASDVALRESRAHIPEAERHAQMMSATGYRAYYARVSQCYLSVSRETGALLYMLARARRAQSMVEFGTSFGISTLHLAAALKDNGGGHLIGTEFEPAKAAAARRHLDEAGLSTYVEIREGDAIETLAHDLPTAIDFVLLDGAKALYPRILSLLEPHLEAGALIVADNADYCPDYLARVRSAEAGYLSVPFSTSVELSMKLALR